jgi:multisubunit Na+/H+ antiporter MnhG subunit
MRIDIRVPIGILFSLLGLIMAAYGIFGDPAVYQQTQGLNINLAWGVVLLAFGLMMLVLGRRGMRAVPQKGGPPASGLSGHK